MTAPDWVRHIDLLIAHLSKLRDPSLASGLDNVDGQGESEATTVAAGAVGKRIVFMATPSHPPRDDPFSRKVRDQRTNMRLYDWSTTSRDAFLAAGFPVIDAYHLTMPFVRDTIDNGHYRLTPAEEAMLQVRFEALPFSRGERVC
jgi:hypothetical protein